MRDLAALREVAPQRLGRARRGGLQHRQRGRDDGVAAEPGLRRRAVERDQMAVDRRLVAGVASGQRRGDLVVHVRDRPAHVEAAERGAAVAQVDRLAAAGRGAGRRDGAADAAAGERDLDLDRRPAARIPHAAPVHLCDRRLGHALPFSRSRAAPPRRSATAASVRGGSAIKRQRGRPDAVAVGLVGDVFDRRLAVDAGEEKARQQPRRPGLELGPRLPGDRRQIGGGERVEGAKIGRRRRPASTGISAAGG